MRLLSAIPVHNSWQRSGQMFKVTRLMRSALAKLLRGWAVPQAGFVVELGMAAFVGYAGLVLGSAFCRGGLLQIAVGLVFAALFIAFVGQSVDYVRQTRCKPLQEAWMGCAQRMRLRVLLSVLMVLLALCLAFAAAVRSPAVVCGF